MRRSSSAIRSKIASTTVISGITFIISFASQMVISYHFGASVELDAYWTAFALMNVLAFPLTPLREALVPELHRQLYLGGESASAYFSRAMTLILMVAGMGCILAWLFASPLSGLAVSHKQPEIKALSSRLLCWLAPAVVLVGISETLNSILAAYNRVVLQSFTRLLVAASTLAILALFSGLLNSYVLPVAFMTAQIVTSFIQALALRRDGLAFRFMWPRGLGARYMEVSGALLICYAASQAYAILEKHTLTSFDAGLVSSFQYAVSLTNVLINVIGITVSSVFWPRFLDHAVSEDRGRLLAEIFVLSKFMLLIMGCLCAMTCINATALIELVFARGAFDIDTVTRTASALRVAVFAAIPISIGFIIGRALLSLGAVRSVMATGIAMAMSGSITLVFAVVMNNADLAFSHWILANLAGLAVQAVLLVKVCGRAEYMACGQIWWLIRWGGAMAVASVIAAALPEPGHVYSPLIIDIILRSAVFCILFAILCWLFGIMRGLPSILARKK